MLRKIALALTAVTALALATTANAQEKHGVIGGGVAFVTDFGFTPGISGFGTVLLIPINIAPALKIEPMVGVFTQSGTGAGGVENPDYFWLGAGAFYVLRGNDKLDINMGGRLLLDIRTGGTDFTIAAALGAEYFLAPRFSLGVEGDLGFYNIDGGSDGIFTQGWVSARFYF